MRISVENFKANQKVTNQQNQKTTLKPGKTSGLFKVTSSIVITMNLEFNSMCRKKKTFPIPLEYIDVTRATCTNLDVLQEQRVDDCWNVDANRSLSDSWTGFTMFTLLQEKPPWGFLWPGERRTKMQGTTRQKNLWPEVKIQIGRAAQKREKQEWAIKKPKLDNARRLRDFLIRKMENIEKP